MSISSPEPAIFRVRGTRLFLCMIRTEIRYFRTICLVKLFCLCPSSILYLSMVAGPFVLAIYKLYFSLGLIYSTFPLHSIPLQSTVLYYYSKLYSTLLCSQTLFYFTLLASTLRYSTSLYAKVVGPFALAIYKLYVPARLGLSCFP